MLLVSIYLCIAGLWNTSVLVEQKIQAQTVADTTAHTIAGDIASTVNEMTMLICLPSAPDQLRQYIPPASSLRLPVAQSSP